MNPNQMEYIMKALKIVGIIVAVMVAAILIIPVFLPATAEVSSEITIDLKPAQIFPFVATFQDRDVWDPWFAMDSTADALLEPAPGYVGSTYAWKGEVLGTGHMEVVSVEENRHIESKLWFGDMEIPARVTWEFTEVENGTRAIWTFAQDTPYPFGRLGMLFGRSFLQQSLDDGLARLKQYLEANPPFMSPLGPISVELQPAMHALVAAGEGSLDSLAGMLGDLFDLTYGETEKQGLKLTGPGFVHYTEFEEATGRIRFLVGFPVDREGRNAGKVMARSYPEMKVVQAVHIGPYEDFAISYAELEKYMAENAMEGRGDSFEFYTVNMMNEPDPAKWQTLITFPLK
jgi:effector-binding domain-containing protein